MSKSLGNFLTLHEARQKYSTEALRFYFLSNHYRAPLDFNDQSLNAAEAAVSRIAEVIQKVTLLEDKIGGGILGDLHTQAETDIVKALDDDFNTPKAFAVLFDFIRNINGILNQGGLASHDVQLIKKVFDIASNIFGIVPQHIDSVPTEIQKLVDEREQARHNKDFATADQLREQIKILGYQVEDTVYGPLVKKV